MFAARGIAEPDHLDPFFCIENSIVTAVLGHIGACGMEEFWRRRGPAGGKNQGQEEACFHALEAGAIRLMAG